MKATEFSHLRVAIYCRKSEESEERQVLSLSAQKDEAFKIVRRLNIENTVLYEESKSAKVSGNRPVFAKLLSDIRRGKVQAIICWKLDRLARNMDEGGLIIDFLQVNKLAAIITPSRIYEPSENVILMAVEFGAANQYVRDLSQNVRRGQEKKAQMGCPPSGAAIGFLNDKAGEKGFKQWSVDPERLPIVTQALQMYLSGNYSGKHVHKWAKEVAKLTTVPKKRQGNKLISKTGIYSMLCNPVYAGFFYLRNERYELASHLPRLITESQHYQILTMLGRKHFPKQKTYDVLYRGYINSPSGHFIGPDIKFQLRCDCKYKFSYVHRDSCPKCNIAISEIKSPTYYSYTYYRNVSFAKEGRPFKCVSETYITDFFTRYVNENLCFSQPFINWCLKHYREIHDKKTADAEQTEENRSKRVAYLESRKKRCKDLLLDNLFSEDEYKQEINAIYRELASLNELQKQPNLNFDCLKEALTIGNEFVEIFAKGAYEEKRTVMSRLGSNFTWDEKNLRINNADIIQRVAESIIEARMLNGQFEPKTTLADKDETGVFDSVSSALCSMLSDVREILKTEIKKSNEEED